MGTQRLGQARGSIVLDTAGIRSAVGEIRSLGKSAKVEVGSASQSVDQFIAKFRAGGPAIRSFSQSIKQIGKDIRSMRTELVGVGLAAGILTKIGLSTAANLEEAQIVLEDMVGSTKQASALMDRLRQQAAKAGIPFGDLLQASRQLLPTLNRNTDELEKWIPIVRRVATLNRGEGIQGAAFAINEALSSGGKDLVSLAERFNISRVQLRAALEQTGGDFSAALDIVLTRMGVLESTADRMGNTFNASLNRAKDAASQLLAAGLTPLLQTLTPILQKGAEWLAQLQQTNPEIVKLGGGLLAATAAGAPLLLFLGQALDTLQKIKALGVLPSLATVGKAGVLGGAAVVGANIGLGLGKGIGRATGNEQVANTTFQDVATTFKRAVFIVAAGLSSASAKITTAIVRGVAVFVGGISNMVSAMARFSNAIADFLGDVLGTNARRNAVALEVLGDGLGRAQQALDNFANSVEGRQQENLKKLGDILGITDFSGQGAAAGGAAGLATAPAFVPEPPDLSEFEEQIAQATIDYHERIGQIESDANEQRIKASRDYEQQRSRIIADYNLQRSREEEDFLRQRARAEEDFARSIQEIRANRSEQEQEAARELNERIDDIRAEGADRIAKIEEDAALARERAERDHRSRLFDAARRLDASAVANELRNFSTQQSDAAVDLARRIEQERANLEERIAQEQEGHTKRIEQARAADEQRIADMIEQFERQKEIEDEERAIALKRTAEDHKHQLAELSRSHQEQLKEIQASKQKELATLQAEHLKQLAEIEKAKAAELAEYEEANAKELDTTKTGNEAKLAVQEEGQEASLESHRRYWEEANRISAEAIQQIENAKGDPNIKRPKGTVVDPQGNPVPGYAAGGFNRRPGLAMLHGTGSRPELIASAATTSALRGMLGNNFSQAQLVAAVAGGGSSVQANINIYPTPNQSPEAIARAVDSRLASLFRSMAPV